MTASALALISGVLLAIYALGILYALCAPARAPDPQRGVAVGCLGLVLAAVAGVGLLLGLAVRYRLTLLIDVIAAGCVYPSIMLAGNLVWRIGSRLRAPKHRETGAGGPENCD